MNLKDTLNFLKLSTFIFTVFLISYVSRIDLWDDRGFTVFLFVTICIIAPICMTLLLSLFSKRSKDERAMKQVLKETPISSKFIAWILFISLSIIITLAKFTPFPASIFHLFILFSWVASLVGIVSQSVVIGILQSIYDDQSKTKFNLFNRYLNALMFGFVYIIFTRISSLPWYVRKLAGVILMISLFLSFMISIRVFRF